jgi:dUTPase
MKIRVVNKSKHLLQQYSAEALAGSDLRTNKVVDILLNTKERSLIPTDIEHTGIR